VEALRAQGSWRGSRSTSTRWAAATAPDDIIEPYLSLQWFVQMKPLAKLAIEATRSGRVRSTPNGGPTSTSVARQRARLVRLPADLWGHQIPIWYTPDGTPIAAQDEAEAQKEARERFGDSAAAALRRDENVLDTWFSSGCGPSPPSGGRGNGGPEVLLPHQHPGHRPGIILLLGRPHGHAGEKIMAGAVLERLHPRTILDRQGRKMSKSLKKRDRIPWRSSRVAATRTPARV